MRINNYTIVDAYRGFSPTDFGAVGNGVADDTDAFVRALARSQVVIVPKPPVKWMVGELDIPEGACLVGSATPVYAVWSESLDGNCVIECLPGADYFLGLRDYVNLHGIIFKGLSDKSLPLARNLKGAGFANRIINAKIVDCGILSMEYGVGCRAADNSASWFGGAIVRNSLIGTNGVGIKGIVDSRVYGNQIYSSTGNGIGLTSGDNSNQIFGNRIEWNQGFGVYAENNDYTVISSNIIDRNYKGGVSLTATESTTVSANAFLRNGRNDSGTAGEDAHIVLSGSHTGLKIDSANTYASGQDDDGTGATTPKYNYYFVSGNSLTDVAIDGSALSGFTSAAFAGTPAFVSGKMNCPGLPMRMSGGEINLDQNWGQQFHVGSANVAAGATSTFTVDRPALSTFTQKPLVVRVMARNGSTAAKNYNIWRGMIYREGAGAAISWEAGAQVLGTGIDATMGGTTAGSQQVAVSNIAADGSSFDVTVKNDHATATFNIQVAVAPQ